MLEGVEPTVIVLVVALTLTLEVVVVKLIGIFTPYVVNDIKFASSEGSPGTLPTVGSKRSSIQYLCRCF